MSGIGDRTQPRLSQPAHGRTADFEHAHHTQIRAEPQVVFDALWQTRLTDDVFSRLILSARGAAKQLATLQGFLDYGFVLLESTPPHGFCLGFVGRPWTPKGAIAQVTTTEFWTVPAPGSVRVTWSFDIVANSQGCRLETSTKVWAEDARAQRLMRLYWRLISIGSSLLRWRMLHLVRTAAEAHPMAAVDTRSN
jgi:hypothetical protein